METSVRKEKHPILISELVESKIQTGSMNGRSPTAPPCDQKLQSGMRSKKSLQSIEHTNFTKSSSREKDTTAMSKKPNFFRSHVPTKAKNTATSLAIRSKEKMYIVGCSASNCIVVSDTHAKVYIKELGAYLWIHLVKDSPSVPQLGRLCNEFTSKSSSAWLQLPDRKQYHPLNSRQSEETSSEKKRSGRHHVGSIEAICGRCFVQALLERAPRSSGFLRNLQFYTVDEVLRLAFRSLFRQQSSLFDSPLPSFFRCMHAKYSPKRMFLLRGFPPLSV